MKMKLLAPIAALAVMAAPAYAATTAKAKPAPTKTVKHVAKKKAAKAETPAK